MLPLRGVVIFRQLQCQQSQTFTYLLGCSKTREAILVDSCLGNVERDSALAQELDLKITMTLDTHVHADHITGASALREKWGSRVAMPRKGGTEGADVLLSEGDVIKVGETIELWSLETPGHTSGCMSFYMPSEHCVFTGDALLIRGCGRTDFQSGNAAQLFQSVRGKLLSLPEDTLVWVGHDYRGLSVSTVREEKQHNPRMGGEVNEHDFVVYMKNLNLPHPKAIAEAVPANLVCGKMQGPAAPVPTAWTTSAHLYRALTGHFEVDCQWLEEHLDQCVVIDVRDAEEQKGPAGAIPNSRLVPLDDLHKEMPSLLQEKQPVIFVCRAGARSAQACVLLAKAGNSHCASLRQGLLQWNREGRVIQKV